MGAGIEDVCKGWTVATIDEASEQAFAELASAEHLVTKLESCYTALRAVRAAEVSTAAGDRRRVALRTRKLLGDGLLSSQGFPRPLTAWFGTHIVGIGANDETLNLEAVKSLPSCQQAKPDAPFFSQVEGDGFKKNVGRWLAALAPRMEKSGKRLEKVMTEQSSLQAMVRLYTKEGEKKLPAGKLRLGTGVSDETKSYEPLAQETHGSPWHMKDKAFSHRRGPETLPFPGLGCIWATTSGSYALLLWPWSATQAQGGSVETAPAMLEGLSNGECASFMERNCVYYHVKAAPRSLCISIPMGQPRVPTEAHQGAGKVETESGRLSIA